MELPYSLDDQFIVLREIKAGGFGIVYAGWDENLNLPIALKEIHPELLRQESALAAFQAEAQLIARLDHPAICRLSVLKRWRGRVFMIMEFIEGGDVRLLQTFLKERMQKLSPRALLYIITQVSRALNYAHMRADPTTGAPLHLVHRDIAPSNFMISRMGAVKLIDFGIARVKGVVRPETMGGIIKGRPQYMSPEQIHSPDSVDMRSDIYSLAVVFLDMLTGHSIYGRTTNEYELLDRVRARKFDLPSYFVEHQIPAELHACIENALKLSVYERTPNARDFEIQLQPYAKSIQFDEERAQNELRQVAQEAFPAANLTRELERFQAVRESAATSTMTIPAEMQMRPPAERSREFTVSDVPQVEPVRPKHGPNILGWALGVIFAAAIGVFGWLVWLKPVPPPVVEAPVVENGKTTPPITGGSGSNPFFYVLAPIDAEFYMGSVKVTDLIGGKPARVDSPAGAHSFRFVVKNGTGCSLEKTYDAATTDGGQFEAADLRWADLSLTGKPPKGLQSTIESLDPNLVLGAGCRIVEVGKSIRLLHGKYKLSSEAPKCQSAVQTVDLVENRDINVKLVCDEPPPQVTPPFVITFPMDATVFVDGTLKGEFRNGQEMKLDVPNGRRSIKFEVRGTDGCRLSRTYSVNVERGKDFRPDDLYPATLTVKGTKKRGQETRIQSLDPSITLGSNCDKIEPPGVYILLPGRYRITTTIPNGPPNVQEIDIRRKVDFSIG